MIGPDGRRYEYGDGSTGPYPTFKVHDTSILWRAGLDPSLGFAEAYMEGRITMEEGDLYDLLSVALLNFE